MAANISVSGIAANTVAISREEILMVRNLWLWD
jgi:hypothetical protein